VASRLATRLGHRMGLDTRPARCVLRGQVSWRNAGAGNMEAIFPTTVASHQKVGANGLYWFVLGPGDYVLVGRYSPDGASVSPWAEVSVRPGLFAHVDVPDMCI